jgi:hypothetical protein
MQVPGVGREADLRQGRRRSRRQRRRAGRRGELENRVQEGWPQGRFEAGLEAKAKGSAAGHEGQLDERGSVKDEAPEAVRLLAFSFNVTSCPVALEAEGRPEGDAQVVIRAIVHPDLVARFHANTKSSMPPPG